MRYLGVSIAAAVMAACAVGVVVPDDATADTEVAQVVRFEIVVPASAVPDPFRTLCPGNERFDVDEYVSIAVSEGGPTGYLFNFSGNSPALQLNR